MLLKAIEKLFGKLIEYLVERTGERLDRIKAEMKQQRADVGRMEDRIVARVEKAVREASR